jgi:hypothetical protein
VEIAVGYGRTPGFLSRLASGMSQHVINTPDLSQSLAQVR